MIFDNLNLKGITIAPDETNPPLAIDADTALSGTQSTQGLKAVAGRDAQIIKGFRCIDLLQFPQSTSLDISRQCPAGRFGIDQCGCFAFEALDHTDKI